MYVTWGGGGALIPFHVTAWPGKYGSGVSRHIWLSIGHIPGEINAIADKASRVFDDSTEWKLDVDVFNKITHTLGTPNIDMFASRLNYPQALAIDAFTMDWTNQFLYAFPPFSILPQFLQKLEMDRAQAILIVPYWSTQPCYLKLTRILIQEPLLLPKHKSDVHLPFNPGKGHPLGRQLRLMDCLLSGNPSRVKEFHKQLRKQSSTLGGLGPKKQCRVYIEKWQSFADKWAVDPLHSPVNKILDFLQERYERGLGYSCLNTARSALSSFIVFEGNVTVGNHPLVQWFLKGVFQTRPAFPRYTSTWDISVVLNYLKTLHAPKDMTLKCLTYKLVMLCDLVMGQRCQTLHLMNLSQMHRDLNPEHVLCFSY